MLKNNWDFHPYYVFAVIAFYFLLVLTILIFMSGCSYQLLLGSIIKPYRIGLYKILCYWL